MPPLLRVSEDNICNEFGLGLLEFCKNTGLRIINSRLGEGANVGRFTYVKSNGFTCDKNNGSSVVDCVYVDLSFFIKYSH